MKSLFLLAATLAPFLLAGTGSALPATEVALDRRQAETAGYNNNDHKKQNNFNDNQKNFDRQREKDRHTDITQKQQQKDVQGDCFLTYEDWDAFVQWDQSGKKDLKNQNANVGAKKGIQHCILTVAELNVYQRQIQNQHQKQRQHGNFQNTKKNGKNDQEANLKTQQKDVGDITEQLSVEARLCVVTYTNKFAQIEKDAKQNKGKHLQTYSDKAFDDYYKKNFGNLGDYNNFKKQNYKNQCIVFYFQLDLFTQWQVEVENRVNKKAGYGGYNDGYYKDYDGKEDGFNNYDGKKDGFY